MCVSVSSNSVLFVDYYLLLFVYLLFDYLFFSWTGLMSGRAHTSIDMQSAVEGSLYIHLWIFFGSRNEACAHAHIYSNLMHMAVFF